MADQSVSPEINPEVITLADYDELLGRERDPEEPSFVCYPQPKDEVLVLNDRTGVSTVYSRKRSMGTVAARYYARHPAPDPEPWHLAEHGEVWLIVFEARPSEWLPVTTEYEGTEMHFWNGNQAWPVVSESIVNAVQIYPPTKE